MRVRDLVHEAQFFEPAARDIEAFLVSSQSAVTGEVDLELYKGSVRVLGARSPYSLMAASPARYGEKTGGWSGAEAAGFTKIRSLPARIAMLARQGLR